MKVNRLDKKQTGLLIKQIDSLYPGRMNLEPLTVDVWHRILSDQDYEKTVECLIRYARENKFPPTAADLYIRQTEAYNSDILKQMREWEKDAVRDE